jgi:predicted Zn-dependent peptidase
MRPKVTTSLHNGIPSHSVDGGRVSTGTLVFGVGFRNEPPTLAGITHLVEHAVLRMVQPVTLSHGGMVQMDSVEFYASGDADDVAEYLNAIAAAISGFSAVSEEDLALEKSIIEAENPRGFTAISSGLLTYRFGTNGLGAGHFGAPTITGLSREEAIEWTRQWFTADNAAITFTGPVPDSLNICLPTGTGVTRHQPGPVITAPTLVRSQKDGVALSVLVPLRNSTFLGEALRYELLTRLRHTMGLIYSVVIFTTEIDDDCCQLDLILDPLEANTTKALHASVAVVGDVGATGFTQDAMLAALRTLQTALTWDDSHASDYVDQIAVNGLLGRTTPTRQTVLDRAAETTSPELTATLAAGLESLIVAVDKSAKVRKADASALGLTLDPYDIWQRHNNTGDSRAQNSSDGQSRWRNKTSKAALEFTETHLLKLESGKTKSIRLADIVLVGDRSCGCVSLLDRRGRSTEIHTNDWKDSKKLRRKLLSMFPTEIIRDFPEE